MDVRCSRGVVFWLVLLLLPGAVQADTPHGGLWWNPADPGHGYDLSLSGSNLALVWYSYDTEGLPAWYLASAPLNGDNWSATLQRYVWDPQAASATPSAVGSISLTFNHAKAANLSWQIGNRRGGEAIVPFEFSTAPQVGANHTGLWYEPTRPGYGLTLVTQGDQEVAVLYFYDAFGAPRWVLGSASAGAGTIAMRAYQGPCPDCSGVPLTSQAAGTVSRRFAQRTSGNFSAAVTLPAPMNGSWSASEVGFAMLSDPPAQPVVSVGPPGAVDYRPVRLEMDFDNNGVTDAVETYSYAPDGRLIGMDYRYLGDGTPDLYYGGLVYFQDANRYSERYEYDAEGRVTVLEMNTDYKPDSLSGDVYFVDIGFDIDEEDPGRGASSRSRWEFVYRDGMLHASTLTTFGSAGKVLSRVFLRYEHDAHGRLSDIYPEIDRTITAVPNPPPGFVVSRMSIGYDAQSRPVTQSHFNANDLLLFQDRYVWNAAGKLVSSTHSLGPDNREVDEHSYNSAGCWVDTRTTQFGPGNRIDYRSRETARRDRDGYLVAENYDDGADGSAEMVITYVTERVAGILPSWPGIIPDNGVGLADLYCHGR